MLLYIIRHGDPIYKPDSLTEKGIRQAEALSRRMKNSGINVVYSSSNNRARMTAEPTCKLLGLKCHIEDWMSEDHAWREFSTEIAGNRRNWAFHVQNTVIKTDAVYTASSGEWHEAPYLQDTRAQEGYARITGCSNDFLARLGYEREGGIIYRVARPSDNRVAAFCHQGFGTIWLAQLLAMPPHFFWANFDLSHSSVTILEFANHDNGYTAPKCLCLSDLSHIYQAGMEMTYNNTIHI